MRAEVRNANGKRIDEASNESEYWNVINDISKPKSETKWKLDDGICKTENEEEIAIRFNNFFFTGCGTSI